MTNVMVTGGNGFIGSHFVNALAATKEHQVTVLDLFPRPYDALPPGVTFVQSNLTDTNLVRRVLEDEAIDIVYHFAWVNTLEASFKNPLADLEVNLAASIGLLEACRDVGVKRVVYLSSGGTVYGMPKSLPIREDHPTNPISPYGIEKLAFEKYLMMYSYFNGLEYVIFRPSVPYGPRQNPHRRQGAVTVFLYSAIKNKPITIWGDGEVIRDYFYVEDMIKALLAAETCPSIPEVVFNLAGERGYSLNQLVSEIEKTLGIQMKVQYQAARKFDVPQLRLDTAAAYEHLGWRPVISLTEGIQRTASWIEKWID